MAQPRTTRCTLDLPRDFAAALNQFYETARRNEHPHATDANAFCVYVMARGLSAVEAEPWPTVS